MKIIGKRVEHIKYGEGRIMDQYDNKMEVAFGTSIKKFLYPESFESFFIILDKRAEKYINEKLEEINEIKRAEALRKEIEVHRQTLIIKENSQAVFDLKEEELLQMVDTWEVSTVSTLQAANNGKIRIPKNLNMNSACVLTAREKGKKESERVVVGLFMVEENFIGTQCETNIIGAHEKYRVLCDPSDEEMYFWDFFPEEKRLKSWGSSKMKYLSGSVVRAILRNMLSTTIDENRREELKEFEKYFCEVNYL